MSLKPSYFTKEELKGEDEEEDDVDNNEKNSDAEDDESFGGDEAQDESDEGQDGNANVNDIDMASEADESDEEMEVDVDESQIEYHTKPTSSATTSKAQPSTQAPSLVLAGGFQWSGEAYQSNDEGESSSNDDDDDRNQPSKKKRKKKQIEHDLTADMHTKTPESNADFERLLLGSPNSSYLWIQYMSFQLPLSEVEKAREIARRAIKTINFREEKEKLNIWIALLNLENVYGTDESLDAVFKEAARANDSKTIYLRLAAIFDQSNKFEVCVICRLVVCIF